MAAAIRVMGIRQGSLENKALLALRAFVDPAIVSDVQDWIPKSYDAGIKLALDRLVDAKLAECVLSDGCSKRFAAYKITDAGRKLVDPKTGLLSRRKIAEVA